MKTDVYFVPETKLGSELLREMQRDNIRMAIVIDEYGSVGGACDHRRPGGRNRRAKSVTSMKRLRW